MLRIQRSLTQLTAVMAIIALAACNKEAQGLGGDGGADFDPNAPAGFSDDSGTGFGTADVTSETFFNETIGDRVFFAVDQSSLSEDAKNVLNGQVRWLLDNPDYQAVIEGHADEQGTREYNLALGARRANAVFEYLVFNGVAANRIRTLSYGKERPLATCANESCYSQNRRAITIVSIAPLG